jgi:hypothetical protein
MSKDFKTIPCYLRKWGESERWRDTSIYTTITTMNS